MSSRILVIKESPKIISLVMNKHSTHLAKVRFSSPSTNTNIDDTVAYLHNINVNPFHRNKQLGSLMLRHMNDYLKENTLTEKVRGVLWDDMTNPYLSSFFCKNGYRFHLEEQSIYDDGEKFFEITPLERDL